MTNTAIRVRFAPSPTGYLHIGGLRTALYDYLFARSQGGTMILRIEDTDQNRLVPDAAEKLIASLKTIGISIDEGPGLGGEYGPYTQSERLEHYHRYADQLLRQGDAYHCFCSSETLTQMREEQTQHGEFAKYDRRCLSLSEEEIRKRLARGDKHVLRLKMPDKRTFAFEDEIRGHVEMESSQSDDQVLIKSDGFPTYHLAAVVDDHLMKISHVIRGEEWLSSTPKHIWLYECLGWDIPAWVHLPLILNPDRSKLSKRMNDVSVESYLEKGYLKETIINFIALLGWHSDDDREIYSLEELCREFSLKRVSKSGAIFDLTKLDWMNGQYIRSLPLETIMEYAKPYFHEAGYTLETTEQTLRMIAVARDRVTLLPEFVDYCRMFLDQSKPTQEDIASLDADKSLAVTDYFLRQLDTAYPETDDEINILVKQAISTLGIKGKDFYSPLRLALVGKLHGPDIPSIFFILGKAEVINRLHAFREICG
ncbi:MAG TPA: glutamate--tRNA ligase [Candidatus Cloacimonadota bacterium]|nr:glutamate--tRNA ligase [Candidatus Cloacimonadota bacterium]